MTTNTIRREKNNKPGRPLTYRFFWTWDHSTNWDLNEPGQQESGCNNPYLKQPGAFLNDYKRVIDYMSGHGLNGLIVWGFLRSSHGGIKSAQALCDYANKKGVKILPGVGVLSYGGVWYEGEHRFNLDTHLKKNPELAAVDRDGNQLLGHGNESSTGRNAVACPSLRENLEWMEESVAWLAGTFNIGGVNLETGDYGICYCPRCRDVTDRSRGEKRVSFADMARIYPSLVKILRNKIPDGWLTYATYTDFQGTDLFNSRHIPGSGSSLLGRVPEYTIAQWTLTSILAQDKIMMKANPLPARHNIGFFHQGSQWGGGRYEPVIGIIKKACDIAQTNKLEGLVTHGEVSSASVPTLLGCGESQRDYWDLLVKASCSAATAALKDMRPAQLRWTTVNLPGQNYNRRRILMDGRVVMAREPDAPVHKTGPVWERMLLARFDDDQGRGIAGLVSWAAHAVIVCGQNVTADFPGELCRRLSEHEKFPFLYLQGACGNLNPVFKEMMRKQMLANVDAIMGKISPVKWPNPA